MKNRWKSKSLSEVCLIKPPKSEVRNILPESDMVSFVPMEDLQIDSKTFLHSTKRPLAEVINSYTYFSEGDVLLAKITPCFENGKLGIATNLVNKVGFGSSEFVVFRPNPELSNEWLYYRLAQNTFRTEGAARMTGAVGHKRVAKEFIENYQIPLPPIDEQKRIVKILDESFKAIDIAKEITEKNHQNACDLFESELNQLFTRKGQDWKENRLGQISKINYGYTESAAREAIGPKFLRITDIQDNQVNWDNVPYCKIEDSDLQKYLLSDGDIVFARTGATTGKSYLVRKPPKCVFASYLIRVQLDSNVILPSLLHLFFQTSFYWNSIKFGSSGSAQGGFNASKLKDLVIPYPSTLNEQRSLVKSFEFLSLSIRQLESIYQQKLSSLEELKKSLLHEAFNGGL